MEKFEYRGVDVTVETWPVGSRFQWTFTCDNGLSGQCEESGTQTESAAASEAKVAARMAIDKKLNG